MKRILILALAALVAASSFAMTDPTFSGSFDFSTQVDFENDVYGIKAAPDASINLNGAVDDWSTVNAEIGTVTVGGEAGVWQVNQFTLTTDVTGALGMDMDGVFGFAIEWGQMTFEADSYHTKAGYADVDVTDETGSYVGFEFTFTILQNIKVKAGLVPQSYLPDSWKTKSGDASTVVGENPVPKYPVMAFEAQFTGGMIFEGFDANVWYLCDFNKMDGTEVALPHHQLGATAGYGSDSFDAGLSFSLNIPDAAVTDSKDLEVRGGVSAKYKMDILEVGAAFKSSNFLKDFDTNSDVGLNVTFKALPELLDVFAAVAFPFGEEEGEYNFGVEGGVNFKVGGTNFRLGYEHGSVGFNSPDFGGNDGLFFMVKADF